MSNPEYKTKKWNGKPGWRMRDELWFLTETAVRREFELKKNGLATILIQAYKGGKKIRVHNLVNSNNRQPFTIYCYDDLKILISPNLNS